MSQGDKPISQKPSNLPAATFAKSNAAAPGRRIPAVFNATVLNISAYVSMSEFALKGNPVPIKQSINLSLLETRIRFSFRYAPAPLDAV